MKSYDVKNSHIRFYFGYSHFCGQIYQFFKFFLSDVELCNFDCFGVARIAVSVSTSVTIDTSSGLKICTWNNRCQVGPSEGVPAVQALGSAFEDTWQWHCFETVVCGKR